MMLFSVFATLALWKINPRKWLNYYFAACAASGGKVPAKERIFLAMELGGRLPSRTTKFDQQRVLPRHFLTHFAVLPSTRCPPVDYREQTNATHGSRCCADPTTPSANVYLFRILSYVSHKLYDV